MSTVFAIDELLQRVGAQPDDGNVWFVLTLPFEHHAALAEDLADVLEIFTESDVASLSGGAGVVPFVESIESTESTEAASLILSGFDVWTMQDWRHLDPLRSNFYVQRNAFLLLSEQATFLMLNHAPNLVSWIGGRVYPFTYGTKFLTADEQEDRLVGLRSWSGRTDDLTPQPEHGYNVSAVMVGDTQSKNFKRDPNKPHIARHDGAWFDFSVLVDETSKPAQIIGFDFELRFPPESPAACIRYDLNTPGHDNQGKGLRFHIHLGSNDLMIHSGPLTPIEILQQFLYGLSIPMKPRSTSQIRSQGG